MSSFLLPFSSSEATLERVGGKGANLAEMTRAGFAVPPGFLVTTEAYRGFVAFNRIGPRILDLARQVAADDPLALEQTSQQIQALFAQGNIPGHVEDAIAAAYQGLSDGETTHPLTRSPVHPLAVAVRSSATAEDLPGLSFAGQQDTYLNIVGQDALLEAVKRCWASLWTARAIGYRARNQIAPDDVALAVVVQQLVPSEVSGVLFTANPLTGRRDEIVIDASFGLGEAIVAGQVEPDHYVVDPRMWRITSRKLGAKALAIVPRADGGTDRVARDDGRQALPDAQILDLARTARRMAEHFGSPQDIEWAWADGRLYLLQSRPITSLYPLPEMPRTKNQEPRTKNRLVRRALRGRQLVRRALRGRQLVRRALRGRQEARTSRSDPVLGSQFSVLPERVYWSLNSVQGVIDPFTPLGRDVIRTLAGGMLRFLRVRRSPREVLFVAGGRLFVDITDMAGLWVKALAHADPGAQQTLLKLFEERRVEPRNPFTPQKVREMLPVISQLLGRALAAIHAPEYRRARAIVAAEQYLAEVREHSDSAGSLLTLLDTIEADLPRFVRTIIPRMLPVFAPGLLMMGLVDRWLASWLGLGRGAALQLMRGLPGNVTSEMDLRLWAYVQTIRADPAAREALLTQPIEQLVEAYERGELPPVAQRAIEQFMDRYGMRGVGEIDFGRPRWREDPASIVQTIQNFLRQDDPNLAPDVLFRRGAAEAERLAAEWTAQVERTRFGTLRAKLLAGAIRRMRLLAGLRESPKFYIIQIFGIFRAALLEHARDLVARGALDRVEDIFFIPLDELRRFAGGAALDLKAIVAAQRAEYEHERARRRMPRLLLSTGEAFYEGLSAESAGDLVGDPVSPGVVEGPARVVTDPRGVRLEPGEILVCPATDPGWTPLFLTAGGLVMEVGGLVTHGSVVAREYGIPAVVGVHQATTRLHTGQRVRVDGTQGRVTVLEEVPSPEELVEQ